MDKKTKIGNWERGWGGERRGWGEMMNVYINLNRIYSLRAYEFAENHIGLLSRLHFMLFNPV